MATDWFNLRRKGRMRAYMVSPNNLDLIMGELTGVDWAASSISAGYYSTTRTSASLTIVGDSWKRNTFIRLVYEIPEWDYQREIGTYLVTNDNASRQNNVWTTTLELHSMLFALDAEIMPGSVLVPTDTSALTVIRSQLDAAGRQYNFIQPRDYRFTTPTVYEGGVQRLSHLMNLCSTSDNRLDVDAHGVVTVSPYVKPDSKTPVLSLSLLDPRGIVFDGVGRSSNFLELPNQSVVAYKFSVTDEATGETTDEEIVAIACSSPSSPTGVKNRGYNITHYETVSDLTPATFERAQELARANLASQSVERVEWQISTKYLPVWEGDVLTIDIPDGLSEYTGRRKCLVKNVDLNGPYWDMSITLKETASGDDE